PRRQQEPSYGVLETAPLLAEVLEQGIALGERKPQQIDRLTVGDDDVTALIETHHAGRNGCKHSGGPAASLFQRALARADIGRHSLECPEYRLELERWVGRMRRKRLSFAQCDGGAAKLG